MRSIRSQGYKKKKKISEQTRALLLFNCPDFFFVYFYCVAVWFMRNSECVSLRLHYAKVSCRPFICIIPYISVVEAHYYYYRPGSRSSVFAAIRIDTRTPAESLFFSHSLCCSVAIIINLFRILYIFRFT